MQARLDSYMDCVIILAQRELDYGDGSQRVIGLVDFRLRGPVLRLKWMGIRRSTQPDINHIGPRRYEC
jgi:hypothetical protein